MNLGNALELLNQGGYLRRDAWPGITYIFKDGEVLFYSHLGIDKLWTPTHADLLANDWSDIIPDR